MRHANNDVAERVAMLSSGKIVGMMGRIITGLTKSLCCGNVIALCAESCNLCDQSVLKILVALIF